MIDDLALELTQRRVLAQTLGRAIEPLRVGRYVLEEELGSGGMGSIWRARDEELGRPVAIKFLRSGIGSAAGEQRLLEEAQALAKLSHPNVVPVFDRGRDLDRVWIAMELIPGRTLRAWAAQARPSTQRLLAAWIDAGRGLAAIHEAGLIHRDVKPDNVLIGEDGRVRVIDLGLVYAAEVRAGPSSDAITRAASDDALETEADERSRLTRTGQFVGTPAYAAPEQLAGARVDARADQYAYALSVWEALSGERPKQAPLEPRESLPVPTGVRVQRRVRVALSRALARDVDARFPDMPSLLAALEPRRRVWVIPLVAAIALTAGAVAGSVLGEGAPVPAPCVAAERSIEQRWTAADRAAVLARISPEAVEAVALMLDDWTTRWREAARRSCEEVHVERTRSPVSLDRRTACLDERLAELTEITTAIADARVEGEDFARVFDAVGDPEACLSNAVLERREQPLEPERAEAATALRAELFALEIGTSGGSVADRRAVAEDLVDEIAAVGSRRLEAEAARVLAKLAREAGAAEASREQVGALFDHAAALADPELAAAAWAADARQALELDVDPDRALWLADRERAHLRELGDPPRQLGDAFVDLGLAHFARGELAQAEARMRRAAELFEAAGPNLAWRRARALRNLAAIVTAAGRAEEALELHAEAEALEHSRPRDLGRASLVANDAYNEALSKLEAGALDEVEAPALRALAGYREQLGPRAVEVAEVLTLLASLHERQGQLDRARAYIVRAEQIYLDVDPRHPDRYFVLSVRGIIELRAGDTAAAVETFELGLRLAERYSHDSSERALARANLGEALWRDGDLDRAERTLSRAVEELEAALGVEHPALAIPRKALGAILVERGDLDRGLALLERALASLEREADNPVELAETRWLTARALAELDEPDSRARSLALARAASSTFAELGPDYAVHSNEIRVWIADNEQTP